jgi:hypothetical protein
LCVTAAALAPLALPTGPDLTALRTALAGRYRVIRPFLVLLAQALPWVGHWQTRARG